MLKVTSINTPFNRQRSVDLRPSEALPVQTSFLLYALRTVCHKPKSFHLTQSQRWEKVEENAKDLKGQPVQSKSFCEWQSSCRVTLLLERNEKKKKNEAATGCSGLSAPKTHTHTHVLSKTHKYIIYLKCHITICHRKWKSKPISQSFHLTEELNHWGCVWFQAVPLQAF